MDLPMRTPRRSHRSRNALSVRNSKKRGSGFSLTLIEQLKKKPHAASGTLGTCAAACQGRFPITLALNAWYVVTAIPADALCSGMPSKELFSGIAEFTPQLAVSVASGARLQPFIRPTISPAIAPTGAPTNAAVIAISTLLSCVFPEKSKTRTAPAAIPTTRPASIHRTARMMRATSAS